MYHNIALPGARFLCQCELCSLEGESLARDEERRGVWVNRFGEVAPGDSDSETERILLG